MKIILIGFMGSGKTTVANILAKKLNLGVIEMDQLILEKSGRSNIVDIFTLDGEEHFRDLETKVFKEISALNNIIVSTGGGVVMKEQNKEHLENGKIFFLETSFAVLEKRLVNDDTRPLFKDKIKAKNLFNLRQNKYKEWADHIILTDEKSINEVVDSLLKYL